MNTSNTTNRVHQEWTDEDELAAKRAMAKLRKNPKFQAALKELAKFRYKGRGQEKKPVG